MSAAITSTDQLVFAGSLDGNLNVYDSLSGEILWSFTFGDFESVSGDTALGAPSSLMARCTKACANQFGTSSVPACSATLMVFSLPPEADPESTRDE